MILVHSTTQSSALKVQNFNRIPANGNFSDFVYCLGEKTFFFFYRLLIGYYVPAVCFVLVLQARNQDLSKGGSTLTW